MMDVLENNPRYVTLYIPTEDYEEVERSLLQPLRSEGVEVEDFPQGGAIVEDIKVFIDLATTAIKSAAFVADRIVAWRRNARERGNVPQIKLGRARKTFIQIANTTDEDVHIFIEIGPEGDDPGQSHRL